MMPISLGPVLRPVPRTHEGCALRASAHSRISSRSIKTRLDERLREPALRLRLLPLPGADALLRRAEPDLRALDDAARVREPFERDDERDDVLRDDAFRVLLPPCSGHWQSAG